MAKRGKLKIVLQESLSPNVIPLIDILFLLLLFLMIGADMGQRELEEVALPKAKNVKEDKSANQPGSEILQRININVYHKYADVAPCPVHDKYEKGEKGQVCRDKKHWLIGIHGHDYDYYNNPADKDKLSRFVASEARKELDPEDATKKRSNRKLQIRADGSAPFEMVQDVMMTAAFAGVYKMEFGAAQIMKEDLEKLSKH